MMNTDSHWTPFKPRSDDICKNVYKLADETGFGLVPIGNEYRISVNICINSFIIKIFFKYLHAFHHRKHHLECICCSFIFWS